MNFKIFYSWQSDLPNPTNRNFIEQALENAAKKISVDNDIEVKPVVDRDTAGIPGSPDITEAIFSKIDDCQAFVCDVSIINYGAETRLTPNPNVLIELGYALRLLGDRRIMMVMNTAFGKPEDLPFDLRTRRIITYYSPMDAVERAIERKNLEQKLLWSIRDIANDFAVINKVNTPYEDTLNAIENNLPRATSLTKNFMKELNKELVKLAPANTQNDEDLIESLNASIPLILQYAQITQAIAQNNNESVASVVFESFGILLENYHLPHGVSGNWLSTDFDYYKFIGHELFVIFFAHLIDEERLELLGDLLNKLFYIKNRNPEGSPGMVQFEYVSQYVGLLDKRNERLKLDRSYLHADILNERHTDGELSKIVPMKEFVDADYFLFLRTELSRLETSPTILWKPHSVLYMEQIPQFLMKSMQRSYASRLTRALNLDGIATFKIRYEERGNKVDGLFASRAFGYQIPHMNPALIATQ